MLAVRNRYSIRKYTFGCFK
ncbi:YSIRK-type signal peptide-containing protein [Zunongwangia profunda]|nr:YSIRK-type signal peptide-containing protein [Zunongwangia profunda]